MECENNFMETDQFETSFLDLNDHCLLKVCGFLDFMDMINVSRTCKRLSAVSLMAATKFKHFNTNAYANAVRRRETKELTALHIVRAAEYVAPIVESITITFFGMDNLLRTLKRYNFPKLKSLWLNRCAQLRWINNKNDIEQLTIDYLQRSELNNYSSGMTKVKELKFVRISRCVSISELLQFFENNLNIERRLPVDFFAKLKNLKMLEFTMGQNNISLECLLQIENLTELVLNNYRHSNRTGNVAEANKSVEGFLTSIAQKGTLKSLDLRSIYFDELMDALAPLNLHSLRLITPNHTRSFSTFQIFI